jgi:spore coat protein U domain-containing protein, fimbrial subunit CupE1/2/3/6
MMRPLITGLGVLATLVIAPMAFAFNCGVTATGVNFGGYDVFDNVARDATGTITVTCNAPEQNPNAPIPVMVSLSPGGSGTFAQRQMQSAGGTAPLNYNLFTNASCSTIWGDGSGASSIISNNVTRATPLTATIFGRIPPRQNVSAGQYSDLITVTIQW